MSLFLRFDDRRRSLSSLIRIRGLSVRVGVNSEGAIRTHNPTLAFFGLARRQGALVIRSEHDALQINGGALPAGRLAPLKSGDLLAIGDYLFCVFDTHPFAEVLAFSGLDAHSLLDAGYAESGAAILHFGVGHFGAALPLPPGLPATVGSGIEDTAVITMEGVRERHCEVIVEGGRIRVTPHGSVRAGEVTLAGPISASLPFTFSLEPCGVMLEIVQGSQ